MQIDGTHEGSGALTNLVRARVDQVASSLRLAEGKIPAGDGADGVDGDGAARAFESYFATMLVRELRSTLPEGMFSGAGSDVYGSWFDEHVGATLARRDALGIGEMIRASLGGRAPDAPGSPREPRTEPVPEQGLEPRTKDAR